MGYRADLYVGEWLPDDDSDARHAWVVFERDDRRFVLEAVHKSEEGMVRPLPDVVHEYVPHFSVDAGFTMRSHGGYLLYLQRQDRRRRAGRRDR
jgi:hypothetical protein